MSHTYIDIATWALVVTLKAPSRGVKTTANIHNIIGFPQRIINSIYARAIKQGFEPNKHSLKLINASIN